MEWAAETDPALASRPYGPGFLALRTEQRGLSSGVFLLLSSSSILSLLRLPGVPKLRDFGESISLVADFAIRNWKYLDSGKSSPLRWPLMGPSPAGATGKRCALDQRISENNTRSEIRRSFASAGVLRAREAQPDLKAARQPSLLTPCWQQGSIRFAQQDTGT